MDNSLLVDLYELTMAQSYFVYKRNTFATFDLFVRALPTNRAYLIACGLKDVLNYLKNLRFTEDDIGYLKKQQLFSADFLKYLTNFRFRGDVWAMPEGTVLFANEPVIRVTASIIEAQLIESFLLNTINLQTMIASKASRVICAASDKKVYPAPSLYSKYFRNKSIEQGRRCGVYDFALRRTHGSDAGIKVSRASYIAGFSGTSNCLAGKLYKIPIVGTMAHSFVMSFKHEVDSFLAYAETFPDRTTLLVDTYTTEKGIENAITIGLYLKEKGYRLQAIRLDSGDIVHLSKLARSRLDKAGLNYVKIFASGNLDEFKIKELLERGAKVDSFGVGTNMGTSQDAPYLDVIYKISEVTDESGKFLPTMKLSKAKVTYPGRKQVFRIQDKRGRFLKDILGLENEKISGRPLLIKVMDKGKLIYKLPSLDKIRAFVKNELSKFSGDLKALDSKYKYPISISPQLKRLRQSLTHHLEKRQ